MAGTTAPVLGEGSDLFAVDNHSGVVEHAISARGRHMKPGSSSAELLRRIVEEVRAARIRKDRWLLVHLTRKDDGIISLGADTIFEGFLGSRELRGPRWRSLASAREFSDAGYSWVVAGQLTACVLFQQLLAGKEPKGVVMHFDAVLRWMPECAETIATVNSVHGFLNPELRENRSHGAKRPGRITRKRLTAAGCRLCGATEDLTLHHLIPREMGGATEEENLLSVCRPCHEAIHSGDIDVNELVMEVSMQRMLTLLQELSDQTQRGSGASGG